eukprot:1156206-Pelagomonas_calceolata.AAC.5
MEAYAPFQPKNGLSTPSQLHKTSPVSVQVASQASVSLSLMPAAEGANASYAGRVLQGTLTSMNTCMPAVIL